MIFSDHNLYGWGASNIDMPRVVFELHPNRLRKSGEIAYRSRGEAAACRWHSSHVSRIFLNDYPWSHTLLLGVFSILIIAYFFMLNGKLAIDQERSPARPVQIVVAILKDEPLPPVMPEAQMPVVTVAPEPFKNEIIIETVSKTPEKLIVEKPKEVKPEVPKKLPPVVVKQRAVVPKKVPAPQPIASATPVVEKQANPEKINITPPAVVKRNYTQKVATKNAQPVPASRAANFTPLKDQFLTKDSPVQIKKNYARPNNQKDDSAPQLKTTANLYAHNQPDQTGQPTALQNKIAGRRYVSKNNALLPAVKAPPPDANRQIEFTGNQLSAYHQPAKRYTSKNNDQRPLDVPRGANQELSFPSQKQEKNALLALPVTNKMIAKTKQPAGKSSRAETPTHAFPETGALEEIDPSQLVSLRAFNVCKDPEKEFRQKTQLAAHFLKPTRIEAQGVVFFVKYTESGYTIQIHIYNPHERHFKDRCEVLDLAIDRITNRVN